MAGRKQEVHKHLERYQQCQKEIRWDTPLVRTCAQDILCSLCGSGQCLGGGKVTETGGRRRQMLRVAGGLVHVTEEHN